jgi:hypothetical protein
MGFWGAAAAGTLVYTVVSALMQMLLQSQQTSAQKDILERQADIKKKARGEQRKAAERLREKERSERKATKRQTEKLARAAHEERLIRGERAMTNQLALMALSSLLQGGAEGGVGSAMPAQLPAGGLPVEGNLGAILQGADPGVQQQLANRASMPPASLPSLLRRFGIEEVA